MSSIARIIKLETMVPFKSLYHHGILVALLSAMLFSCSSEEDTSARLVITMVDSPGDYTAVNIDIQGISVHSSSSADEEDGDWIELDGGDVGIKNILDYTSGTELTLADTDFPAGTISQIRLQLGENNTLDIEQEDESIISEDLKVPSGGSSGLKLKVNETLEAGVTYKFTLDFDVNKSIVATGNGKYILKPVIKVITEATSGAVRGTVTPASENVAVYIINEEDTVGSSFAGEGVETYLVTGIPEGTYSVAFDPGSTSDYDQYTVKNVTVDIGFTTEVEPVSLQLK